MQKPVHTHANILERRNADDGKRYFELRLQSQEHIEYLPGQYLNIVLNGERRSFSITNLPSADAHILELLIERIPNGLASSFLDTAPLGTTVEIIAPYGRLIPQHDKCNRHVLVGTGSGIASLKPIAEWLVKHTDHVVFLLWGLRYRTNIFWRDFFDSLARVKDTFHYMITLSQADEEWEGLRGRVTSHLLNIPFDEHTAFYLCGGKPMLDDVRAVLKKHRVQPSQILTEQFHL